MSLGKRGNLAGATLVLLAMTLVLAGCGSGGGSTESTTALSKAEFVKKGNAICARTEEEVERGVEQFTKEHKLSKAKPPTEKQIGELAEEVLVPKVRKQIGEIRALGFPAGEEKEVEAILAAAEAALKETEEDPTVFSEGTAGPFVKANTLAREYGLTVCGAESEAASNSGGE